MNLKLKNLLGIFLSLFISHSLWSMEVPVKWLEILELPVEIQKKILIQMDLTDLPNMLCTCQSLQKPVNEILPKKAHEYFGEDAAKYKTANMRWGAVLKEHFLMPRHVLKIDSWTKEELEFAISDERFAYHERHLLKHLEEMVTTSGLFKIDNGKDLVAALVQYDCFFIHATCQAAWWAAMVAAGEYAFDTASKALGYTAQGAARDVDWDDASKAVAYTAKNDASKAVGYTARGAAWDNARVVDWDNASNAAWDAAWKAAKNAVSYAAGDAAISPVSYPINYNAANAAKDKTIDSLLKVDIKDSAKIAKASWKLSNLFMLAYISQRDFIKYFHRAFMAAKEKLDRDARFNMNKAEIIKIWEESILGKEKLKSNPYILTFRNVALKLAAQIDD